MKVITIGRGRESNIVINDAKISRIHLQIVQDDNGNCSVVDLNSANGTFVNGRRIRGEFYLQSSDTVMIGDTFLPWQSYLNKLPEATNINVVTKQELKPKSNRTFWFISVAVLLVLLLTGGGVFWKINHNKRIAAELKKEIEKIEKIKKIEEEANETVKAKNRELEIEERDRKEAQKKAEEEKKAREEAQKAKEVEKREKESAQAKAEEEKRHAEETQKKKDKAEFDNLKLEAEKLKGRGANPAEKIDQMKKIAEKYPNDSYFQSSIKNLEN